MSTSLISNLGGTNGFGEAYLPKNDDSYTSLIDIRSIFPNGLNFFGSVWTGIYINNNGNITFINPSSSYTPTAITGQTNNPIIAAFWADIDTRGTSGGVTPGGTSTGTNLMWYDLDPTTGTITVTWDDVGYFSSHADKLNAFQLQLVRVNDSDFDIVFRYEDINWTTGDYSGGSGGLGGNVARAGYSSGDGANYFELPQSGNQAGILALESSSNIAQPGIWQFQVRSGAPVIAVSIDNLAQAEGNGPDTTTMTFDVILSSPTSQPVQVDYFTQVGTAGAGDFIPAAGSVTFAPGQTRQKISVEVIGDTTPESNETFFVNLGNAVNAAIGNASATGTITNDDGLVIGDVRVLEGTSAGTANAVFTVTLLSASSASVTVDFTTVAGSASAGADFTASSGSLTFAPGETSKTISVAVVSDATVESDETFSVQLSGATGASIFDASGLGTIVNDDGFSVNDVSLFEGSGSGTTPFIFDVKLSSALTTATSVDYQLVGASATAGTDFVAATGTLTFAAGTTSQQVTVNVNQDSLVEPDETFQLLLSNPVGGTAIADGTGVGTIRNDDGIFVSDAYVLEGNSGTASLVYTVTLSSPAASTVTVAYATGAGTATAGSDYTATTGTLTFTAGSTSQTVSVPVIGDVTPEANETVTLQLSSAVGTDIVDGTGVGTIRNDDGLSIAGPSSTTEGNSGTKTVAFTVSLSAAATSPVSVDYATADGTATAANNDYVSTSGTLTFAAGETSKTVNVTINGDTVYEPNETFRVLLSNPVGSLLVNSSGTASVTNDDTQPPPAMYVSDASQTEGSGSGTTAFRFFVSLSQVATGTVTVDYATVAGTATASSDFTPISGTLTFQAGESSKELIVPVVRDALAEANETFSLALSNPVGSVTIADGTGLGTILNDDVTIAVNNVRVTEGNTGTTAATFSLTLSGPSPLPVSVDFATANGTAVAPGDYAATTGTVTFAPGETIKQVSVAVVGDSQSEPDETFQLLLSNPAYATLATAQGTATVVNDDQNAGGLPTLSITPSNAPVAEGNSGPTPFTFTVTRAGDLAATSSATWTVTGSGTNPANGADFVGAVLPSGSVSFAAGQATATVTVNVQGDTTGEPNEGFTITLANPVGATLGTSSVGTSLSQTASGGYGVTENFYTIAGGGGAFTLTYDMLGQPDKADIYVNGTLAASTNTPVSYTGTLAIPSTTALHAGDQVKVVITGVESGTLWSYSVNYQGGVQSLNYIAAGVIVNDDSNVAAPVYTVPGTLGNDFFLPSAGNNYLGGGGNDTYIISHHILSGAVTAKITDTEGSNVIQLVDGLTVASSTFYSNAVQLTLSNGASVQILGASRFIYQVGANASTADTASNKTYAEFAALLGASVPAGSTPVSGTTGYVVPTGSSAAIQMTDDGSTGAGVGLIGLGVPELIL